MNWKPPKPRHFSGCYTHSKNLISMQTTVTSNRKDASLKGQLFGSTDLRLSQTNAWPVPPDKGYPTLDKELPEKRWHFTAETERVKRCRIAAIFSVRGPGESDPRLFNNCIRKSNRAFCGQYNGANQTCPPMKAPFFLYHLDRKI